jgi:tetratricopeptide (TPR) repeat protein
MTAYAMPGVEENTMKICGLMKILPVIAMGGCFFVLGCSNAPSGMVYYYEQPSRPALSSQARENLTEADIDFIIQKGDEEYAKGNFSTAKDFYYEVLLAVSDPSVYVLVSYGACLGNLGLYENAVEIFNIALEKDHNNEVAKENIAICRQFIAKQTEEQRQFALEQQEQQRENMQNLMAALNSFGEMAQEYQNRKNSNDETGAKTGNDYTSSGSNGRGSSSRSQSNNSSYNFGGRGGALDRYRNEETAARHAYDILESDYKDMRMGREASMAGYHENDLRKYQGNMKTIREEAARNGHTIQKSRWEDDWPRRP